MGRRELLLLLWGAVTAPHALRAEQKPMRLLGFLHGGPAALTSPLKTPFTAALERGLNETGYVEGENLRIEYRHRWRI